MSKHTKGPWTIHSYPDETFVEVKGDEGFQVVATVRFASGDRDANAALIAASPELLEALEVAHALIDPVMGVCPMGRQEAADLICAAIAKVKGESA